MREYIISEIQRIAEENGGQAPGVRAFVNATGIIESKWLGKYWTRWTDALAEAGFEPNSWQAKADVNETLWGLITACRHFGHFPTRAELNFLRNTDSTIPSPSTLKNNFGVRADLIEALKQHIAGNADHADVLAMLPATSPRRPSQNASAKAADGHVYLFKAGDYFKIGRTENLERRVKEVSIALPQRLTIIHTIKTDDPSGIETYWHKRFADKRVRPDAEWFKLTQDDVKAFMRRKFQ